MAQPPMLYTGSDLCAMTAFEVCELLKKREVSPAELVEASLARMAEADGLVNAVVTKTPDRARSAARKTQGAPLHGIPLAIKDLTDVKGVRTTYGSPAFSGNVPRESDPIVLRLEERGGIVMGKTNTPEFGAGGNTFNKVFGPTRNPFHTGMNAGGSSGGAAAALATGQIWLAHGSDLGGSLRTPAAYCGIVGLRPSPGVAGGSGADLAFATEGVQGPMARTVVDVALMLDAMSGFDPVWPISCPAPPLPYLVSVARADQNVSVAYAPTLGGFAPVEPEMDEILRTALAQVEKAGGIVEEDCPKLPDLAETYMTLRAMIWAAGLGRAPRTVSRYFKDTLRDNIQWGLELTSEKIYDAMRGKSAIYHTMRRFLDRFDVLACPVVGAMPRPVEVEWPRDVAGKPMRDYMEWLRFSFLASTAGLPAISVPVGFSKDGLPVGLQLIGGPRGEARLLQVARAVEDAVNLPPGPIDPIPGH